MLRREFLEVLGISGLGSRIGSVEETQGVGGSMDVELVVALPDDPGEYMARVTDDAFDTTGYWRGSVKENPKTVSGGSVDVRSNHGFVMTEGPSKRVSGTFFWIEGISKVVVDFRNEKLHLIYRDTDEDVYWNARKKAAYHSHRMTEYLNQAKTAGEGHRKEMWRHARRHRDWMHQDAEKGVDIMNS